MKLCTTNTSPDFTPICPCLHKDKLRHMELHTSNILKVNQIVNKNLQIFFSLVAFDGEATVQSLWSGGIKKQDHISTSNILHRPLIRCPIKG